MKNRGRLVRRVALTIAILAMAVPAQAAISYAVGGTGEMLFPGPNTPPPTAAHELDGQGYPGDMVEFVAFSDMLVLTPGTSVLKINTLRWNVDWTYAGDGNPLDPDAGWVQLLFNFVASRTMTIGSSTGNISQPGSLEVNWDNDYLTISGGSTTSFSVPGYQIDVTPIGIARHEGVGVGLWAGTAPWPQADVDVMAQFDITEVAAAVPEPASIIVWSLVALTVGGVSWRRRRNLAAK